MEKLIILGSGPAGLTAAIYASRANLNPILIEGMLAGGQLVTTTEVENFPGFPEGIQGPELIARMKKQAEKFGTRFVRGNVTKVSLTGDKKIVEIGKEKYEAQAVIIATGATARYLGLKNEQRLVGHGVSGCATCDGFFFKNMEICVVGGGDTAMEDAIFLTKFATKVTTIHRRDKLRASKAMQDRAIKNPKIKFLWDTVVEDVLGDKTVEGIRIKNLKTGKTSELKCQGLFLAIGHDPATGLLKGQLDLDQDGFIITTCGTSTNVKGVYACGDVQDKYYKQAVSAAGSGCMAALDAEEYLSSLE
jgi:thioredoxin reductase (NADPH)